VRLRGAGVRPLLWQVFWLTLLFSGLPIPTNRNSGEWCEKSIKRAYSSGDYSGFSPDSLLWPCFRLPKATLSHHNGANIGRFLMCKSFRRYALTLKGTIVEFSTIFILSSTSGKKFRIGQSYVPFRVRAMAENELIPRSVSS